MSGRFVARRQGEVRERLPVRHRRVAPPPRLDVLNAQEPLHAVESLGVDPALQAAPGPLHPAYGVDAGLVVAQQLFPQSPPRAESCTSPRPRARRASSPAPDPRRADRLRTSSGSTRPRWRSTIGRGPTPAGRTRTSWPD